MAAITAALVKDLREKTGAGMMDCKKALTETDGDIEVAIDWLRKKGLAAAAKKSGRDRRRRPGRRRLRREQGRDRRGQRRNRLRRPQRDVPGFRRHGRRDRAERRRRPGRDQRRAVSRHRPHGGRATDPSGRHDRREHDHPARQGADRVARRGRQPTCTRR